MDYRLSDILSDPGLIKLADTESPDEVQLENDFANLALVFLRDRAPALQPFMIGFEVIDREEDGSRAVGIFGFKIGNAYYYVPAFFVNGQLRGMDILFSKNDNRTMPLTEEYIKKVTANTGFNLGEPGRQSVRQDFERPNFDFLSDPSIGMKTAGLEHLFSYDELRAMFGKSAQAVPAGKVPQVPGAAAVSAKPGAGAVQVQAPQAAVAQQATPSMPTASANVFRRDSGIAPVMPAPRIKAGFDALLQGTADKLARDPGFKEAFAGAIAKLEKKGNAVTTARPAFYDFIKTAGGINAMTTLLRTLNTDIGFANAALYFYPSVSALTPTEFSAPQKQAAKLTVVSSDSGCGCCDNMTEGEKHRLVRDSFTVVDRRDKDSVSDSYDVDTASIYSNPDGPGAHQVFLQSGAAADSWVSISGPDALVIDTDRKFYFSAPTARVWIRSDADVEEQKSLFDAAAALDSIEVGRTYVFVGPNGQTSIPLAIKASITEDGRQPQYDVSTERQHCGFSYGDDSTTSSVRAYDGGISRIRMSEYAGKMLSESGACGGFRNDTVLVIPNNWKALELTTSDDYCSSELASADVDNKDYSECSRVRSAARHVYDEFGPGDPRDIKLALAAEGCSDVYLESSDGGISYDIGIDGAFTSRHYKRAMLDLVFGLGLSVDDAEQRLKTAAARGKSAFIVKRAQVDGIGIDMPYPDVDDSTGYDSDIGAETTQPRTEILRGEMTGLRGRRDPLEPGFAIGGQSESELQNGGGEVLGADVKTLAEQARQSGQRHVFDHASLGGMARMHDAAGAVDLYMPQLRESLDKLGRILFLFYWKNDDFEDRYGASDMSEMEDTLRGVFKSYGDLLIRLDERSAMGRDKQTLLV